MQCSKRKRLGFERYCTVAAGSTSPGSPITRGSRLPPESNVGEAQVANDKGMTSPNYQHAVYSRRFAGIERHRLEVWRTLARHYFHRWVKPTDTVVDVGAGYCEFINSICAAHKYALDSNPATAEKAASGVTVLSQQAIQFSVGNLLCYGQWRTFDKGR